MSAPQADEKRRSSPTNDTLEDDGVELFARELAATHQSSECGGRHVDYSIELASWGKTLEHAHSSLAGVIHDDPTHAYMAEWLLDNFYIVQKVLREIPKDMPAAFYRRLPLLADGPFANLPRVYALARALVDESEARVTPELLQQFIQSYQTETPLTTGELWALPPMLRTSLIRMLATTVSTLLGSKESEEGEETELPADLAVANCIQSLRQLDVHDWETFHESVSVVEERLRKDPAKIYRRMDFETRDRYREVIEDLADSSDLHEIELAELAVQMAQEASTGEAGSSREGHVGYYLVDAGRAMLEERIGYRAKPRVRIRRAVMRHASAFFFCGVGVLSLLVVAGFVLYGIVAGASLFTGLIIGLLVIVPALTVSASLVNFAAMSLLPPRILPKLEFGDSLPESACSLLVVPALFIRESDVDALLQDLELHYLRNHVSNLWFALLTDYADASTQRTPGDQALLERAKAGIEDLNSRYERDSGPPFLLLHRERLWNPIEGVWMGWERKRGKLEELNRLILGKGTTSFTTQFGTVGVLPRIKYVITLDADTILLQNGAKRLIGALAHPLNRAEFEPDTNRVIDGYTVLQPRPEASPTSANASLFARIFAGDVGLDLYTRAVSDVYQDLFGEGIYVGKGIYDVAAFDRSVAGRVPENALLSHDLFEGVMGRAGLVSDIVVLEDYPSNYLVFTNRLHRWVRGDWQLLPWLFPRVPDSQKEKVKNRFGWVARWKIADNLLRSLLEPSLVALLVAGWLWLPGSPLVWTLVAVGIPMIPLLTGSMTSIVRGGPTDLGPDVRALRVDLLRWLAAIVFLPYEASIKVYAVGVTLYRLFIRRREMLQWTTAAHAVQRFGNSAGPMRTWKQMRVVPIVTLGLFPLVFLTGPDVAVLAAPFLLAWFFSPHVAYWLSRPRVREAPHLDAEGEERLRRIARRTWFFFERFVGPEDHWLPPDHFQESPKGLVAHRTSPTNIGLYLLSALSAYDMGYADILELTARLKSTFATLDRMEKYQGHLLNWYDTHSLAPLPPRYVSSVDSGNFAACLLALRQGCIDVSDDLLPRRERWEGLADTLAVVAEFMEDLVVAGVVAAAKLRDDVLGVRRMILEAKEAPSAWADLLTELITDRQPRLAADLVLLLKKHSGAIDLRTLHNVNTWSKRVHVHLSNMHRELLSLTPWVLALPDAPQSLTHAEPNSPVGQAWQALRGVLPLQVRLGDLEAVSAEALEKLSILLDRIASAEPGIEDCPAAERWCQDLEKGLTNAPVLASEVLSSCTNAADSANRFLKMMDFRFLFDEHRKVFRIGYNVDAEMPDPNFYDLLASEARITSLVAIAKGDVPLKHWLYLSRPVTQIGGKRTLMSWNGTMFEYLMPSLFMRSYEHTLLDESIEVAVQRHIDYAQKRGIPWGISESGYFHFDANMNYQYRGFGVPGLGFKRGLSEDLVVAPYASLLALGVRPKEVDENIDRFEALGMLGDYGFYEAVDFTPSRLSLGMKHSIVQSYMSHHQGMILVSLLNYLRDGIMPRRFHDDALIHSFETLLQEQVPYRAPIETVSSEKPLAASVVEPHIAASPWSVPIRSPLPFVHFVTNGRLGTMVTNAGSGYCTWLENDVTRWRSDTTLDGHGSWIYLQDVESGELWSLGEQPISDSTHHREVSFHPQKVAFQCTALGISARMELLVATEDDVEIRRVKITNDTSRSRRIRIASYSEMVLAPREADRRHPAFTKLFVESDFDKARGVLTFSRRARDPEDQGMHVAHTVVVEEGQDPTFAYETDRRAFIGRNRSSRNPLALEDTQREFGSTVGAARDPIAALSKTYVLEPHQSIDLAFLMAVADSRSKAVATATHYRNWTRIGHAFDQARVQAELVLRRFEIGSGELECYQQLLSALIYPHKALRAVPEVLSENTKGQSGLWGYGISGDYPILLVKVRGDQDTLLLVEVLRAHAYWRHQHIKVDLVILNEKESSYAQEDHGRLHRLLVRTKSDSWLNRRGGIFLLRADSMRREDAILLASAASIVLEGHKGPLEAQLRPLQVHDVALPVLEPIGGSDIVLDTGPALVRPDDLLFDNGIGGFSPDGSEYVMYLEPDRPTPAPWVNVIANPDFGCLVSESGAGFTWSLNSGENRLTPWANDPVADPAGEALYLRDEETGTIWSPTPSPSGDGKPYLVRHGAGYSVFEHVSQGLIQRMEVFVAHGAPVKIIKLRIKNTWPHVRRLTATYYAEWVLGVDRENIHSYVVPSYDHDTQALLAQNTYSSEFSNRVAFLAASEPIHSLTTDRSEFLGRLGDRRKPDALRLVGLSGRVQAGVDPCAALQVHLDIPPEGVKEIYFILGQEADQEAALKCIRRFKDPRIVEEAWEQSRDYWENLLGKVVVETPEPAMNLMLNRWLLYQTLSCRIWGRSALYQASGAYGFRDQLQDVMAILLHAPEIARDHILRAARHQFEEGDVMHWWHPPSPRGVRTRITDDLLWLPYVTAQYVSSTGDVSILREEIPFVEGEALKAEEVERYAMYQYTKSAHSLYEHCVRAIKRGTSEGPNGLPLMGAGDWNDGMNRVGVEGHGESVWLGWFLYAVLVEFAPLCEEMDDARRSGDLLKQSDRLREALELHGWDGKWYRRAYYDDGHVLGSAENRECRIDSIAQSWAVLSGAARPERGRQAMDSAYTELKREAQGLFLIFDPPFDKTTHDPGYIKGYPPGVRENGGQYTHAAAWAAWAFTLLGDGDRAEEIFRLLNPIYHADSEDAVSEYRVEPYVVSGDIYSVEPYAGRGGWTWYTGAAGWMYRLGLEAILGIRRRGEHLLIDPCIPKAWPTFSVCYRYGKSALRIRIDNKAGVNSGVVQVSFDGELLPSSEIPLVDDGREHDVFVILRDSTEKVLSLAEEDLSK